MYTYSTFMYIPRSGLYRLPPSLSSNKDFRGHTEPPAEATDVLGGELAFSPKDFRDDAGRSKNVQQVFLLQLVCGHQFVEDVHGIGRLECVVLVFEVFDEQSQK